MGGEGGGLGRGEGEVGSLHGGVREVGLLLLLLLLGHHGVEAWEHAWVQWLFHGCRGVSRSYQKRERWK